MRVYSVQHLMARARLH